MFVKFTNDLKPAGIASQARALYPASAYESLRWAYLIMATTPSATSPTGCGATGRTS